MPSNELWQEEARRIGGPLFAEVLMEMRETQKVMLEQMKVMEKTQEKLMSGFPASDVDGHRRYHQTVIEWREHRNKMLRETLSKLIGAGVLAGCGWLLLAIWQTIKTTVMK